MQQSVQPRKQIITRREKNHDLKYDNDKSKTYSNHLFIYMQADETL